MSPRFKGPWRPSLFKLMLMVALVVGQVSCLAGSQEEPDPLEPCYLANNRASESLTISESTPVGSVVGEIMVNGDSSAEGNIELSIRMPAGGQAAPLGRRQGELKTKTARELSSLIELMPPLSIELASKRLVLAKKLDRENMDRYAWSATSTTAAALTVHVRCQLRARNNSQVVTIPVHLIVTDENDNWPSFVNAPYIVELNESAPAGALLAGNEIAALDADQAGPLSTIEYSIVPGSLWSEAFGFLNPLDARSLVVRDNHLLDYEAASKLTLRVMARDQGEPANWAISALYVNLLDQDDLGPSFQEDQYEALVRENRPGEQLEVGPRRLLARDLDRSLNAPLSYAFHARSGRSAHFELDQELGKLSLRKRLPDSWLASPFCLLLRASQLDNPARWTLTALTVRPWRRPSDQFVAGLLAGGAEPAAAFLQTNFTLEISEASGPGASLLEPRQLLAAGELAANLSLQLLDNELGYFQLEPTGHLRLNRSLDYELHRHLSLRLLATRRLAADQEEEAEEAALQCEVARLELHVLDVNEHAPEFSHDQYNFQLSVSDLIANFDSERQQQVGDSMQLGQVYCADRDFNDRCSLSLQGSRASLFQLSQDGRLYLLLANGTAGRFPQRRQDSPADRSYLNHLLSELSQVSRLRLKVLASDGAPEAQRRRSSALVLISILSVDNFILQRNPAAQQQQQADVGAPVHLSNQTSYDTSASHKSPEQPESRQLMMIPATNGRSFVQIQPDIVSNLIMASPRATPTQANESAAAAGGQDLQVAGSSQAARAFQPPSLLLVDDDGAKFVAMPAAIELYNQQVQEAAEQQLERRRSSPTAPQVQADSTWSRWLAGRDSPLYWANLSTAVLLHLIAVAAIFTLVARYRTSLADRAGAPDLAPDSWLSKRLSFLHCSSGGDGGDFSAGGNQSTYCQSAAESAPVARPAPARFAFLETHGSLAGRSFGERKAAEQQVAGVSSPSSLQLSVGSQSRASRRQRPAEAPPTQEAAKKPEGGACKSSTFIGSPRPAEESQVAATTVVSINTSRTAGQQRASSLVSLVSLASSSSISHKIGVAVERHAQLAGGQASTGSDVSSLDSQTLFNGIPTNRAGSSPRADETSSGAGSLAGSPPQPPPLPPPPPPSLVQAAVRLVEAQAAAPPSRPFSARPADGGRRPLPQNPQHLRLRRAASGSERQERRAEEQPKRPPTPPPMPPGGKLPAASQTGSPTTSVDRGYESFQSYSSSSQTKCKPHDLKSAAGGQARAPSSPNRANSRCPTAIPAPPSDARPQQAVGGVAGGLEEARRRRPEPGEPAGRVPVRINRSTRSLAGSSAAGGRQQQRLASTARPARRPPAARPPEQPRPPPTNPDDTEDDDFYYCYPGGRHAQLDYASHAYRGRRRPADLLGLIAAGQSASSALAAAHRPAGRAHPAIPRHQARDAASKKQLTWSDQVRQ